jgi:phospholipid transport system substrate-binding protein
MLFFKALEGGSLTARSRTLALATVAVALAVCLVAHRPAEAEPAAASATAFVQQLADDAIGALSASEMSDADRQDTLALLMRKNFDTKLIARFVVGSHWKDATSEQRDQYLDLFGTYFIRVYANLLGGYGGETLHVLGQKELSQTDALVATRIAGAGATFHTDLRVRRGAEGFQIIDIVVDQISMLATHRSEFSAVAKRQGFGGLIEVLKRQTESLGGTT